MREVRRISSLAKIRRGASPRPISDPKYFGGEVGWVRIVDVTRSGRRLRSTEEYLSALGESMSVRVRPGDLIMSICGTIGRPIIVDMDACIHDGFVQFYDLTGIETEYLYYSLQFSESALIGKGQPGTQVNLNTNIAGQHEIYCPSLEQQRRIAKLLSLIDTAIEKTEALIAKHQQIKAGLMHDLFTRGVLSNGQLRPPRSEAPELYQETALGWIPRDWQVATIESALRSVIDYRGKTPEKTVSGVPLITAKNVRMGYIDPEPREFIAESAYVRWMTRGIPVKGDVLFTTEAPLGNVAQVPTDERMAFAQRAIILQPSPHLDATFLAYRLMAEETQQAILRLASGSTALGIKQSEFRKILMAHPCSTPEQVEIVRRMQAADAYLSKQGNIKWKLQKQKLGLMHDLLTGRVPVPVHPEPAETVAALAD